MWGRVKSIIPRVWVLKAQGIFEVKLRAEFLNYSMRPSDVVFAGGLTVNYRVQLNIEIATDYDKEFKHFENIILLN